MNEETKQNVGPEEIKNTLEPEEAPLTEEEERKEANVDADASDEEEGNEDAAASEDEDTADDEEADEEYEDDAAVAITTATAIDGPLLDTMVKIMARQTKKSTRRNCLIGAIAAAVVAIFCLTQQRMVLGFILWVVAVMMFQSYTTTSEKSARKRLAKSEGQVWDYTFAEDGIHVGKTVASPCIAWGTIKKAWLEEGYYIFEIKNSNVVIRQSDLSDSDRNAIELLMLEHVSDCKL